MAIFSSKFINRLHRIRLSILIFPLVFLLAGCGSEFVVLLDKYPYLPIINSLNASGTVYWSEQTGSTGSIKKMRVGGTDEIILLTTAGTPLDIALYKRGRRIYWAEDTGTAFQIKYANLNGTGETIFLAESNVPNHGPSDIAIDTESAIIYWNRYQFASGHNDIWRVNLSSVNPLADENKWVNQITALFTFDMALDAFNRKIYFSVNTYWDITTVFGTGQSGELDRYEMDIANTSLNQITETGPANPSVSLRGIAVDGRGGYVYYTSNTSAGITIIRTDLLLQNPAVLITASGFDIDKLALDLRERKIYWTSSSDTSIYRANIDGTGIEVFRSLLNAPTGIAISY